MLEIEKLNDDILVSFLKRNFFDRWSGQGDESTFLELIVSDKCDHNCSYCYYRKYGHNFFNEESRKEENILRNLDLVLNWLEKNNYRPRIELFSGELFSTETGFKALDRVIDYLRQGEYTIIPSNMSFIFDDEKIERILLLKKKAGKKDVGVLLSGSVDGKYMEENRPLLDGRKRDDEYYHKLFTFAAERGIGFHPMVYSKGIEKWKDNFLWFMENYDRYGLDKRLFYLLEVRNAEWNEKQTLELGKFVEFLVYWAWDFCGKDADRFVDFIFKDSGFNILSSLFSGTNRGISCSIQSSFAVTLGNLSFPACHRTAYGSLLGGRFVVEKDEIVGIKAENASTYINIKSFDAVTQPYCETCYIKHLCVKGCLGSQFETTGNPFIPIPSVCRLEHVKTVSILRALKRLRVLDKFLSHISRERRNNILLLEKEKML